MCIRDRKGGARGPEAAGATAPAKHQAAQAAAQASGEAARAAGSKGAASAIAGAVSGAAPALLGAAAGIVAFVACALAVAQLLSALFGFWDDAASKQGLEAVSYTHLDVYKRQDKLSPTSGARTKDFVMPSTLDFKPEGRSDCFRSDERYGAVLAVRSFGSVIEETYLASIIDLPLPLNVTLLALPQNQPNAPLYPAGGAPGSRPGALPHFGRPRYLGPPPREMCIRDRSRPTRCSKTTLARVMSPNGVALAQVRESAS